MDIRSRVCFMISRKFMKKPEKRTIVYDEYEHWRHNSLSKSWKKFDDSTIYEKDVLDFGCGDGPLTIFLAKEKRPRRIVGIDISETAIDRANNSLLESYIPNDVKISFELGTKDYLPFSDKTFDTLLAFDCLEHVMSPESILFEWYRVLRPGGSCLIEWFPYKGPWGPHMEALIPIPWAHVIFGEQAMFRAAEAIYDLPDFIPRHWDLDEHGQKNSTNGELGRPSRSRDISTNSIYQHSVQLH